ncbi:MAG TPA: hypothetical protein VJB94_00805 [Candidatus Nanoarchaeia archaeon]|nr:hypothetical protein [Candidatus Nanoarchaeia archaeon]
MKYETNVCKYENKVIYLILSGVISAALLSVYSDYKEIKPSLLEKKVNQDKTFISGLKR